MTLSLVFFVSDEKAVCYDIGKFSVRRFCCLSWDKLLTHFTHENVIEIGISIGVLLLFLLFRKIFTKYVFAILLKISKKTSTDLFSSIFLAFKKPIQWLFIIIGIYLAVKYFPFLDHKNELFLNLVRASVIILVTWGLVNLASSSSLFFKDLNERYNFHIDEILIPFFSRALKFIIIAISVSVIAQEFGYHVSGFVAGLGLGGLAISLAAQDALRNLVGGVVIIGEKPFTIGDWILTPSVEGTVEDINFRSTKVRTFADALVTVPNATLASEAITNWSKMGKRQITFNLSVTYDTSEEQLEKVIQQIRDYLQNHPGIHKETIFVNFNDFQENGFDIFLYFFTITTNWGEYLKIKEEINFKILETLKDQGVKTALPARRFVNDPKERLMGIRQEEDDGQ